jgi:flagellin-like protein
MATLLKNKKGLSPLIATILLIAFAVALGAVVMNIGRTTVLGAESDSTFTIVEIGGTKQICNLEKGSSSILEFTLKNGNEDEITDLQISIIGSKDITNLGKLLQQPIGRGELRKIAVGYDSSALGQLKRVIITPVIIESGQPNFGKAVETDTFGIC